MVQYLKRLFGRIDDAPVPEQDPIVHYSYGVPMAIFSLLMILSLVWAFYEEAWGMRPWRAIQNEFFPLYEQALGNKKPLAAQEEAAIRAQQGYIDLQSQLADAESAVLSELQRLEQEEAVVRDKLAVLTKPFASARSEIQAKIYEVETTGSESLAAELETLRERQTTLQMPEGPRSFVFAAMETEFNDLKAEQGRLQGAKIALLRAPTDLRREMNTYVRNRMTSLTDVQLQGLIDQTQGEAPAIRQIHNPAMRLILDNGRMEMVDRCESCHMGVMRPVSLTAEEMGNRRLFASHPRSELLSIHDPQTFGCAACHNGNGIGTVSADKGHGNVKHWLWPLHAAENVEAGCLQCHEADHQLEGAPVLNAGRVLFQNRGCQGCHPREGFDREPKDLRDVQKQIVDLRAERDLTQIQIERAQSLGDQASSNEEANRLYADAEELTLRIAEIDSDVDRLGSRVDDILKELKRIGPNLKEVKNKLRKEWLPGWIRDPQAFRPNTKMPQFRLTDEEVEAISAFVWQSGLPAMTPSQPAGDAAQGKRLFESRGCLACHSVGDGDAEIGSSFAANLTRVGEKANYDYLVRWIHNPRERTLPYDPVMKRDVTEEDYRAAGQPFVFDLDNNQSPLGDHLLQVQNQAVMPSLRLSLGESRDVATYLVSLGQSDPQYPAAPFMDDTALFDRGRFLVRHYGCAGCHEIAGLEEEGKIGTDLTVEGSKPIERLDFALLTHDAKHDGWYNHKGFFERKLADPAVFDDGKIKEPLEKLRMPNFHLGEDEIDQLTTFLLGSVVTKIPEEFHDRPTDARQYAQAGWWLIKKYNCTGCHSVAPGQEPDLASLPFYQGSDVEKLPPPLVGEGARVDPDWLKHFLDNPAMSDTDLNRNGVRPYLDVRMPTFNLSQGEIQQLIKFFSALSNQTLPYIAPTAEPLTQEELVLARRLFTSNAAPCLRCHATGDPRTDGDKTAPDFALVSSRLKPDWTKRWIVSPEVIQPGTAMPSGLFRWDGSRWVFALGQLPGFDSYEGDHAELVVRYMLQFTPQEQRRVTGR